MEGNQTTRRKKPRRISPEVLQARSYFREKENLLSPPITRAAYSDRMAWILASMADLAYDKFEEKGKPRKLFVLKLKGGGFELLKTFHSVETDTQAFLAKSHEGYAILAFRGTETAKRHDFVVDAAAMKVSVLEGRIHSGFRTAYASVARDIQKSVLELKDIPLYITGHSLGAALATIATQSLEHHLRIREMIAACYTFGSPRVGDRRYDREFRSPIYRVVNTTDIVTVIPLLAMGYIHIGDIRYLGRLDGEFRRGIPFLQRWYLFMLAMFKFFGPVVGDHDIAEYRRKLEAIAQKRNPGFGRHLDHE